MKQNLPVALNLEVEEIESRERGGAAARRRRRLRTAPVFVRRRRPAFSAGPRSRTPARLDLIARRRASPAPDSRRRWRFGRRPLPWPDQRRILAALAAHSLAVGCVDDLPLPRSAKPTDYSVTFGIATRRLGMVSAQAWRHGSQHDGAQLGDLSVHRDR
jgi:hypothetical protein